MMKIPAGTEVRPMMEAMMIGVGALGGLFMGLPLSAACLVGGRRWWSGWILGGLGIVLSLSPWFLGNLLWDCVVARQDLIMKP